jgi:amino acid adenylation domain-containing protein
MSNVEDLYELSPMQQGMLFHALREHETEGLYVLQVDCVLRGPIDVESFTRAWQLAIDRHPVLRTSFHWTTVDKPLQVVHRQAALTLMQEDFRDQAGPEQRERLEALAARERRSFDLEQAPLMRLALIRLAESEYRLLWTFHHIILEGWSASLVLDDVSALYGALRRGESVELEPRRPFRDYILWLQQQDPAQAEKYWRNALKGIRAPTPLSVDRPARHQEGQPAHEDEFGVTLSTATSDALRALAKRHRLTINTIVQGAWALLLSRYAGQQDVVFGSVVSGRPPSLTGSQSMIGLFINTLAARVRVDENAVVTDWLEQFQREQAEMREYEHSALVDVQGWSEVPRGRPLFESILIPQNWLGDISFQDFADDLEIGEVGCIEGATGYALIVYVVPGPQMLLSATYERSRFEEKTIERLVGHWRALFEGIASNPTARVSELSLLTAPEALQLTAWNATDVSYSRGALLTDLFEAQVVRAPEATAAEFEAERLSYRELNERANVLARELRGLGVGPGVLVGVYMERSIEMLVALLGVLKAGGAYVPLDPSYPAERVAYMLEDSEAPVLLTQESLRSSLPDHAARVVCIEAGYGVGVPAAGNPERLADAEDLAYVIYTSGSTGRPKGVQVTHRSLVNFLESMQREPGFNAEDVLLSVTTLSFDIAGLELYLPLVAGGRVVLVSREEASDGERLAGRLKACGATVMQATPATWRLLVEAGWAGDGRLKLLCGGEALPRELSERLVTLGSSLWNMYGPTETTIWSALWKVDAGPVSVGRPIGNTQTYVLDGRGRRVPVGVPGELCIGGEGLARGYLKRPDLTAERFVPDPFAGQAGARMYRTGDLVRFLPDGRIEWLSRLDHQVKVRGFRIELGEIESVLARHAAVKQAVAVVREDVAGDARLVAYVVSEGGPETGHSRPELAGGLREHLLETLPEYMVPTGWMFLDAFPLTPNGKVDRKALPRPEAQRAAGSYAAPESATDRAIADVWQEVLRVERVGMHDNFFDLGGHSLLLMQVQGKLRRLLERDVPIVDLFRHPTVAALGRHLRDGADGRVPVEAENVEQVQIDRQRMDRLQQRRRQQAGEER